MHVFKSLNCRLCREPFARAANQPRSPVRLPFGGTVCRDCCDPAFRKHIAYYFIDVLSEQDALMLAPDNRGYLLAKPIKIPECPVCHDEYSNQIEGKKSSFLQCGHAICTQCSYGWKIGSLTCPVCNCYSRLAPNPEQNGLNDFLDELPKMIRQMAETHSCDDCHEMCHIDEMFHCPECSSKSCGFCAYKKHQGHQAIPLLELEFGEVSKEIEETIEEYLYKIDAIVKELLRKVQEESQGEESSFSDWNLSECSTNPTHKGNI